MGIKVEVDEAIESGKPFGITLSVDVGEPVGTFDLTLTVDGQSRDFALQLGASPPTPKATTQTVKVRAPNNWQVSNWGTGNDGDAVRVTAVEHAPGTREDYDEEQITP